MASRISPVPRSTTGTFRPAFSPNAFPTAR